MSVKENEFGCFCGEFIEIEDPLQIWCDDCGNILTHHDVEGEEPYMYCEECGF